MKKFYISRSTDGFYVAPTNKSIPADAVEISRELWQSLRDGQSRGKRIAYDEAGMPVLSDAPAISPIPKSVTRRQAFQAMEEAGILDAVISWADSQPRSVRIDFDQSASFDLGNPLIEQASAALGLTDDDVLGLFAIASTK